MPSPGISQWISHCASRRSQSSGLRLLLTFVLSFVIASTANAQTPPTYTSHTLASAYNTCVAVDKAGNIYFPGASPGATTNIYAATGVYELVAVNGIVPRNPTVRTLATNFVDPYCVAVNPTTGDLFVTDATKSTLSELVAVNGSIPDNPTIRTINTVLPGTIGGGLSVDPSGDVFFSSAYTNGPITTYSESELVAVNGVIPDNPTARGLASQTDNAGSGVQIGSDLGPFTTDSKGDFFYQNGDSIEEYVAVNGTIPSNATAQVVIHGLSSGYIAVDTKGNIFLTGLVANPNDNTYHSQISEIIAVNGSIPATNPTINVIFDEPTSQFSPVAIAVDGNDNVFASNYYPAGTVLNVLELSPSAAGTLTIAPVTQSFPVTAVGGTSSAQVSKITNGTSQAVYLSAGSLTDSLDFTQNENCGIVSANGGTCTVTFTFTPQSMGALTSTYSIHDLNHPESPLTVALSGNGTSVAKAPAAMLSPSTADFGNVTTGTASTAQAFTLSNTGTTSLGITSVSLTGANSSSFSFVNNGCANYGVASARSARSLLVPNARAKPNAASTLPAGNNCTLNVVFSPTSAGASTATLTIVDDAGTQTATLTGTGVQPITADFTVTATPASQIITSGASANYSVSVASTGGTFAQGVALTASGLPPGATVTFSPASVTPGSSSAQSVMNVQTAAQSATARNDLPSWPFTAPLSAALLVLLPRKRFLSGKKGWGVFTNLACLVALLGIALSTIGCGGGFALPSALSSSAKTYTITVTGTSGSVSHSTTVTLTVQ